MNILFHFFGKEDRRFFRISFSIFKRLTSFQS